MKQRFLLYAIYGVAREWGETEPFDLTKLPFEVAEGVRVEDVSAFIKEDSFKLWRHMFGERDMESLGRVHYALVYRYEHDPTRLNTEVKQKDEAEFLLRNLAALLRLIRPMRQDVVEVHGEVNDDGTFDVHGFGRPINLMEVPEVQKLFTLRNRDLDDFRKYAPEFLRAARGEYWKVRMAVQFHDTGHWQDLFWKARYSLWCSSIEALFTSSTGNDHKGSLVATERVKWFLGEDTPVYSAGDIPNFLPQCSLLVKDVVSDLYIVRNLVAHGDRVPDKYLTDQRRQGLNGYLDTRQVLLEAASFIIRTSLLKILREGLLEHFMGAPSSDAYFSSQGLTHSQILARRKQSMALSKLGNNH